MFGSELIAKVIGVDEFEFLFDRARREMFEIGPFKLFDGRDLDGNNNYGLIDKTSGNLEFYELDADQAFNLLALYTLILKPRKDQHQHHMRDTLWMDLLITVGKMNPTWMKSHDGESGGSCGHHEHSHEHKAEEVCNDCTGETLSADEGA
ncbi:MAG TPA: hypothetical protein VFC84_14200 [Desulfosporosinus sp.]|nr:hypothetical protein [Desulfosporosinus sp.]